MGNTGVDLLALISTKKGCVSRGDVVIAIINEKRALGPDDVSSAGTAIKAIVTKVRS
ncbi:MAG: hypothetical protein ACFFAY_01725 [Promethearchaeota archaeon]